MNVYLAVTILVLATGAMFAVPLLPALLELYRKFDALPLSIIQQHAGEIRYFADSFRTYIKALEPTLQSCLLSGSTAKGTMLDGTGYLVLGHGEEAQALLLKLQEEPFPAIIASATDLRLPSDVSFSKDIYSAGRLVGGRHNTYRAMLAEKDIQLPYGSTVLRWGHAVGGFEAGRDCKLFGRVSSDSGIALAVGCRFSRLNAPRISVGERVDESTSLNLDLSVKADPTRRVLHQGNFEIRAGELFRGNLVVRGKLCIGAGARVFGSVKAEKVMVVEEGVSAEGSLTCGSDMRIGPRCAIRGPVIAERSMILQAGTRCGTPQLPTTVSAPRIEVEEGVEVFGTLWAREEGQVVENA